MTVALAAITVQRARACKTTRRWLPLRLRCRRSARSWNRASGRTSAAPAFREKLTSLITLEALVLAIVAYAAVFVASQFTPVGSAADIGIALTAVFVAG